MRIEEILQLVNAVSQSALTEFKYEEGAVKLSLKKTICPVSGNASAETAGTSYITPSTSVSASVPSVQVQSVTAEETKAQIQEGNIVKSPLVGTFYTAPSEDAEPFVKVGDSVKEGQVLAIVEAMKLMNDIDSDYTGTVAEILVENGETVEYGQPLFVIK